MTTDSLTSRELAEFKKCKEDPAYFLDTYAWIFSPMDGKIPFKLFDCQRYVIHCVQSCRMNIVKKPRQMGLTWLISGLVLHQAMFYSYKTCLIVSIRETAAIRVLQRIKFIYKNLPAFLQMPIINGKKDDLGTKSQIEFSTNSLIWSIASSEEAGRSEAAGWMIIDEAAFVQHMDSIWASAYPTLSTGGRMLLCSTTNGIGNMYHKVYTEAQSGKNTFNCIDLKWHYHPERDINWYNQQRRDLGLTLCAQEVDGDFLTSGNNVFDLTKLAEIEQDLIDRPHNEQRTSFFAYNENYERLWLGKAKSNSAIKSPCRIPIDLYSNGELKVWNDPEIGKRYVIGVDTAKNRAVKLDNSAAVVLDADTLEVCAEFCGKMGLSVLPSFVYRLGMYYNQAFLVIENTGIGHATVYGVHELGYEPACIYSRQSYETNKFGFQYDLGEETLGFSTNTKSKPIMISDLSDALDDGSLLMKSLRALNEMKVYTTNNSGQMTAADGYTDDLVMAYALAIQGRKAAQLPMGMVIGGV